ncbi:PKD domain-containing protein [Microbacterium foliorum]
MLMLAAPSAPAEPASACTTSSQMMGLCGSTDGSSLAISGTQQQPSIDPGTSSRQSNGGPGSPGSPGGPSGPGTPSGPSQEAIDLAACMDDSGTTRCAPRPNRPAAPATAPPATGTPTITISDLARFAPASVLATAEPGNVGIAGMPTNFTAAATPQIQGGELFGVPLRVRFVPAAYDYTYGDGSSATLTTPGRTWEALGQAQFTPTPTSHVYREPGAYPARVDIRYAAQVDLGGGWIDVPGQLTTSGATQEIRILEARTALVAHTCDENPAGVGC